MDLELVTIGTELLLGFTVDTNSAFMGRALADAGVRIARRTTVRDDPDLIRATVAEALERSRFVITTGGLGPTRDDMTKKVVAELFDAPLEFQPPIWEALVERFAKFGRVPAQSNRGQAEVPRGATVLPNRWGTAPGLWLSGPRGEVVMLPGVPAEMKGLLTHEVAPRLRERAGGRSVRSRVLRTTGIPESTLAERIAAVEDVVAPLTLAYLPGIEGVDLRLTAWDATDAEAEREFGRVTEAIRAVVGDRCYGTDDDDLAAVLVDALRDRRLTLAVAESCTGGLVGGRVTAVPGSSDVFLGGVIAYANELKTGLLGVREDTIGSHGAVSEAVAREMALGVRARSGADVAVSVTGIAGPGGGSAEKPVGLVWFAFAGPEGFAGADGVAVERVMFPGSREDVRGRAAQTALHGVWRRLALPDSLAVPN
ncbi:MAG: competence/damage-inducible protein A [Gemmatimonadales bacterium]